MMGAMLARLRRSLGVVVYDIWRYHSLLSGDGDDWLRIRNRAERLIPSDDGSGFACDWQWTSLLHAPRVFPYLGRRLMARAMERHAFFGDVKNFGDAGPAHNLDRSPEISFIVGHRGEARLENLWLVLRSVLAQTNAAVECIVVEQSDGPTIADMLPRGIRYVHAPSKPQGAAYNRALAFNVGAAVAKSDLLVLHDNDFLVPVRYASDLLARWQAGFEVIDLKRFIFYLSQADSVNLAKSATLPPNAAPVEIIQNLTGGGSIAVDRRVYWEIGGHDEGFVGWGGEDVDFWDRAMTRRLYPFGHLPMLHLWHAPQPGKTPQKDSAAMQRYHAMAKIDARERIRRLRAGRSDDVQQASSEA